MCRPKFGGVITWFCTAIFSAIFSTTLIISHRPTQREVSFSRHSICTLYAYVLFVTISPVCPLYFAGLFLCQNSTNCLFSRKHGRRPGRGLAYQDCCRSYFLVTHRSYMLERDRQRLTRQPQRIAVLDAKSTLSVDSIRLLLCETGMNQCRQ